MDRFGNLVWSIARKYCSNTNDAEDASQDIFLEIWKSASRFDPSVSKESTFVAMIARRRLIDRVRRSSRRIQTVNTEEQFVPSMGVTDPDRVDLDEKAAETTKAFMELRPEQRQILQLSIHHGRSHEQIAVTTGMPLGTVKTHARRGLMRLRQLLTTTIGGPGNEEINCGDVMGGAS